MGGRHRAPLLLLCVLLVGTWVTSASARAAEIVDAATPHLESGDSQPTFARPATAPSAERRLTRAGATVVAVIPQTTLPRPPSNPIEHDHGTRPVHDEVRVLSCADARAPPGGTGTAHVHLP